MPGTPKTGYMLAKFGPFMCRCCKHYVTKPNGSGCDGSEVIAELGKGKSGLAPVAPDDCCNEFSPRDKPKPGIGARLAFIGRAAL